MTDQYLASLIDSTRSISFDSGTLLTSSAINALHFPGLSTSGISDSGGNRRASLLLDGIGMCESMTESFCSTGGQDDTMIINTSNILQSDSSMINNLKLERKDSTAQRKRRSRKSQFDASVDGTPLDKIETVALIDEQNEPDDVWLFEVPKDGQNNGQTTDNIFSWVHKEFKTNDINASKHRLLCKLDDMSHARTIRSVSCHNFADSQRLDAVKKSSTEQQVTSEPVKTGRLSSPIRILNMNPRPTLCVNLSPLQPVITVANASENNHTVKSREVSREREKEPPMDYTDLEVMAKLQLENLRQAEQQGPLSKRFGGSNVSLASTGSGTSVSISNRTGTKPPVAPKPTITKNGVKLSQYSRSNTQTITTNKSNEYDVPVITEPKLLSARASVLPPNSANNNRTRPPIARPIQAYRGSQTSYINNVKVQNASTSVQRNGRKPITDFSSTYTTKAFPPNENGLLNDVSNKPLTAPLRSQLGPQRRTIVPQSSSTYSSVEQILPSSSVNLPTNRQATVTRSSSSLSQGRKSGIPTVGKPLKPSTATVQRPTSSSTKQIPSSQSTNNMMVTRTIRTQVSKISPQISEPISSWNEGCY
ncbi:unnamed protein product [Adineta steineri]|uniref:Uncharacterized protein n=1 Tax=Adineta steineri TaxID=433720 RepID=A0A815LKQ3_9BILA|nr:unnamed protein product [Adineta steineri]CAF3797515.1 unnamed protein product [Adineta steineri]